MADVDRIQTEKTNGAGQTSITTPLGNTQQQRGSQINSSTSTDGEQTTTTTSVRAEHTVTNTQKQHAGITITFRVPFKAKEPTAVAAEGATATLGPNC